MTTGKRCVVILNPRQADYLARTAAELGLTVSETLRRLIDFYRLGHSVPKEQVNHGP